MASRTVCLPALTFLAGCTKSQNDADGQALGDAARAGNLAAVKTLLAKSTDVNWKGKFDAIPLLVAAQQGNTDVMKTLIFAHANVKAKTSDVGARPLELSAHGGYGEVVKVLIAA